MIDSFPDQFVQTETEQDHVLLQRQTLGFLQVHFTIFDNILVIRSYFYLQSIITNILTAEVLLSVLQFLSFYLIFLLLSVCAR